LILIPINREPWGEREILLRCLEENGTIKLTAATRGLCWL
jgi:hypothetical protein